MEKERGPGIITIAVAVAIGMIAHDGFENIYLSLIQAIRHTETKTAGYQPADQDPTTLTIHAPP